MGLKIGGVGLLVVLFLLVGCVQSPPPGNNVVRVFSVNPVVCDNSSFGGLYANSNLSVLCFCNSTTWVSVSNNSVEC